VKFVEIELEGRSVRAKLHEKKAPNTVNAIWDVQTESGKDIEVVVDGIAVAHGHLLEETSPGASAEPLKRLPFVGVVTNSHWAGR